MNVPISLAIHLHTLSSILYPKYFVMDKDGQYIAWGWLDDLSLARHNPKWCFVAINIMPFPPLQNNYTISATSSHYSALWLMLSPIGWFCHLTEAWIVMIVMMDSPRSHSILVLEYDTSKQAYLSIGIEPTSYFVSVSQVVLYQGMPPVFVLHYSIPTSWEAISGTKHPHYIEMNYTCKSGKTLIR